jgi:putative oxidoreductase
VRRLFWTFAPGVPGAALLAMRVVTALALVSIGISKLSTQLGMGSATILILETGAGLLLLVGLWTPVAGLLVLAVEGWHVLSQPQDPWTRVLLATLCGALALLGPGAWSVDARLFGWKRIDIRDRRTPADASADPES